VPGHTNRLTSLTTTHERASSRPRPALVSTRRVHGLLSVKSTGSYGPAPIFARCRVTSLIGSITVSYRPRRSIKSWNGSLRASKLNAWKSSIGQNDGYDLPLRALKMPDARRRVSGSAGHQKQETFLGLNLRYSEVPKISVHRPRRFACR